MPNRLEYLDIQGGSGFPDGSRQFKKLKFERCHHPLRICNDHLHSKEFVPITTTYIDIFSRRLGYPVTTRFKAEPTSSDDQLLPRMMGQIRKHVIKYRAYLLQRKFANIPGSSQEVVTYERGSGRLCLYFRLDLVFEAGDGEDRVWNAAS